ncbi:hypothetical protein G4G27_15245 [Sphingomonas sp. So64.6b]|uniref:hypothetical protein n=1 Tax=Sphingomonas sp. So64.6b TaxID=2997354 RepID=UPI001603F995|nr:hypothetical protein [Sphingomonas sp. So64.6b]QNA85203.1 hypothetical protein G4G27_15245 [Sphingomonas sp. So64.6b]
MSVIATAMRHLIDAGVSGDALYRAIAELEAATDTRSPGARRMARYRARQGQKEQGQKEQGASPSVTSVTCDDGDDGDGHADLPPNDINSNPPSPSSADADATPLLVIPKAEPLAERVTAAWNLMAAANGLAEARGLSVERRTHLAARVREHGEAAIFEAIERLGASDWHCGRSEGRGDRGKSGRGTWKADLGWLLKSGDAFLRILERPHETRRTPVMSEAARAAYLRGLEDKPWAGAPLRTAGAMETA